MDERPSDERLQRMLDNSYKNFHAKGLDYLCLRRSPDWTRKVYFLEGDVTQLPEVINPHDHRYDFSTKVLAGVMSNSFYEVVDEGGTVYNEFLWDTPLLGGKGFTWSRETQLAESGRLHLGAGDAYFMAVDQLHTIRMHADQTVIVLDQYEDIVPVGTPTRTFVSERKAPDLSGLYERMDADHLLKRLEQYKALGGKL